MILLKFLVVMRAARTPAPRMDAPVIKMPLVSAREATYHPAPMTLMPIQHAMPRFAQTYGDVFCKKPPTSNWLPEPV